jgi:hypothetical protein
MARILAIEKEETSKDVQEIFAEIGRSQIHRCDGKRN